MDFKLEDREKRKLNDELQKHEIKKTVDFGKVCEIYAAMKNFVSEPEDDANLEYLDAFVALGGNTDKSGIVKKDNIINTLKSEFDMEINFEDLMGLLVDSNT